MDHKISIIIPTYNRADKITASIESVLNQTYGNFELLVIDDASTDNTEEVIRDIRDDRVSYHRLPDNSGAGAARNAGVQLAKYDIIGFQDSDDIWHPDKLEKQLCYWEIHRDFSMIYSKFRYHEDGDSSYDAFAHMGDGSMEGDLYKDLFTRNTIGTPTVLVDKGCFLSCGGFDSTLRCLEDWEFFVRFAKDYLIGFVDEELVDVFLVRGGGVSSNPEEYIRVRFKMLHDHRDFLTKNGMLEHLVASLFLSAKQAGLQDLAKKCLTDIYLP